MGTRTKQLWRRAGVAGAVAAVAVAMTACGSSSPVSSPTTASPGSSGTTAPTTTPSTTAAPTTTVAPTTTTTAGGGLNRSQLKRELLTVSDLPSGWTSQPVSGGSSTSSCRLGDALKRGETGKAEADFGKGDLLAFDEEIAAYATPPKAGFHTAVTTLNRCGGLTASGIKLRLARIPFPTIGTESAAYQATGKTKGLPIGIDIVIAMKGDQALAVLYGGLGKPEVSQVVRLAKKAAAKLPA